MKGEGGGKRRKERDGRESLGGKGGEGKRQGKGEGKENLGGEAPKCFFLEPRLL